MSGVIGASYVAPETAYLPFNGTTNIGFIDNGATGYTTQYALVLKMAALPATNAGWPVPGHLSYSGAGPIWNNVTEASQLQNASPTQHRHVGFTTVGGINTNRSSGGISQCSGAQVHMIGRDLTANTTRIRIIKASDQTVFWGPADAATNEDSTPDDIIIGGYGNPDGTLNSSPCDLRLVSVVFLDTIPSDALLQAYAAPTCRDARPIFGSSIKGYWAAAQTVGSATPPLVGSASLALTGLTRSDLVAF